MGFIVAGGRQIEVPELVVETWRYQPKLGFPRMRPRKETRAVVAHWTGGVGKHEQVFRTLVERNLSVHFVVDPDGSCFQHCDADMLAAHCKGANQFSVGIEIVNPATTSNVETPPRTLLRENIHGVDITYTAFYPAQVKAALLLVQALCAHYELPVDVPMVGGDVASTVLPATQLASYRGVLGHLHVSPQKTDCGLMLLRAVHALQTRGKDGAAE